MRKLTDDSIYEIYGIRNDTLYLIETNEFMIKGEILNFNGSMYAIKSYDKNGEYNHYHIRYRDVVKIKPFMLIEDCKKKYIKKDLYLYSKSLESSLGCVGEETNIKDAKGCKLRIGDIVELSYFDDKREDSIIVKDNEVFVMGLKGFKFEYGAYKEGWKIERIRESESLKEGECLCRNMIVKSNNNDDSLDSLSDL